MSEEVANKQLEKSRSQVPVVAGSADQDSKIDLLYRYVRDIQRFPLLTLEEEQRLTRKYAEKQDPRTAYKLVTSNLRLVIKIAFEYRSYTAQVLDLIQEGNIGLVQAIKRFDPLRGVRLSHYAQYWIRSYIIYYLLNNHRMVKLGTTQAQRKIFFNLRRERKRLLDMGFDPTARLIATNLSVPESTVVEMMQRMDSRDLYLDAPQGHDGKMTLMSTLASPGDLEAEAANRQISGQVQEQIQAFGSQLKSERDQYIWTQRLLADEPKTLQEIGDFYGISRERARQLEERIKKQFKQFLQEKLGPEYVTTQVFR